MNEKELNHYIATHEGSIKLGLNQLRRSLRDMGRRCTKDDLKDVAQELRIVEYKCLKNYKAYHHTTMRNYIDSSIQKYVYGLVRTQCKQKHTDIYNSASLSDPVNGGESETILDTIIDDKLTSEPRLDAVIFSDSLLSMLDPRIKARVIAWLDGLTYEEIGLTEGVTGEAVRQSINCGIDRLLELGDSGKR